MCAKLVKTMLIEFYDDYTTKTTVTEIKEDRNTIKGSNTDYKETYIVPRGSFATIVNTNKTWDKEYSIRIPKRSKLMEYLESKGIVKIKVEVLGKEYEGTLQNTGRICGLSKLYEITNERCINFESGGNVMISYNKDRDTLVIEFIK